jgi:hypothetical protein
MHNKNTRDNVLYITKKQEEKILNIFNTKKWQVFDDKHLLTLICILDNAYKYLNMT